MTYKVKLPIFEGPLDLLLYLIKKEELDIYDIPIAKITEQYLEYLELMRLLDLNIAGEFLVMAATLMHIKSRMLLPPDDTQLEEEMIEEDPRAELVRRLLEYKKFKEAADKLKKKETERKKIFTRTAAETGVAVDESACFEASIFDLISAFTKVLTEISKDTFYEVIKDEYTVSEKIHQILHVMVEKSAIFFTELFKDVRSKSEVIATFLALLELIRLREIRAEQGRAFGEIKITRNVNV